MGSSNVSKRTRARASRPQTHLLVGFRGVKGTGRCVRRPRRAGGRPISIVAPWFNKRSRSCRRPVFTDLGWVSERDRQGGEDGGGHRLNDGQDRGVGPSKCGRIGGGYLGRGTEMPISRTNGTSMRCSDVSGALTDRPGHVAVTCQDDDLSLTGAQDWPMHGTVFRVISQLGSGWGRQV
jgi:hypothetical protein